MTHRRSLIAAAAVLLTAPALGHAEPTIVRDTDHNFEIRWPSDLTPLTLPVTNEHPAHRGPWKRVVVAVYRGNDGTVATLTRMPVPGRAARRHSRAWARRLEASLRKAVPGYHRNTRRTHRVEDFPVLDLVFDSRGERPARTYTRWIWFRTYTLVLAVEIPRAYRRSRRRTVSKLVRSFRPYVNKPD